MFAAFLLSVRGLHATDVPEVEAETDQATKLAKRFTNPISSLISVPFQANEDFGYGPSHNGYKPELDRMANNFFLANEMAPSNSICSCVSEVACSTLSG